jgi:hypothetical protein
MPRAILIIWSIGLAGALVATLAILKQVALVLRTLQEIHSLAVRTRDAARGIAANVRVIRGLGALEAPVRELREATVTLAAATASIERKVGSLVPGAAAHGGRS